MILAGCLTACAAHDPRAGNVLAHQGDPVQGQRLYAAACVRCHAVESSWPLTLTFYGADGVVSAVIDGVPESRMPSFAGWSDQQLADVLAYLRTLRN